MSIQLDYALFDQLENDGSTSIAESYQYHLELAERADQAGFTHWFKSEHHHSPLDIAPSINVFLSAVIQRTKRIKVASLVHLLPFYEPMRLYEELCMLDHLSEGRLEIGFGKGVSPAEQLLWGVPSEEAAARAEESLDFVLSAMRLAATEGLGCLFSYQGKYWSSVERPLEIGPYQTPHPPLWRPGTLSTAAQLGASTILPGPISVIPGQVESYLREADGRKAGGHTPLLSTLRRVVLAPTDEEATAIGERAWQRFDGNLTKLMRKYDLWPPILVPSFLGDVDMAHGTESLIAGSPSRVREYFEKLGEESGLDHVTISPAWGDITGDEALRTMDLFVEQVADS
tara:strand:- start:5477 stop:6505 length:1029 start_codon:yes stop_codon:yes gene_type:complete